MISRKEHYQRQTETRLKKITAQISMLESRVGKAEADIKVRYNQKMNQIRGQYAQTKDKLGELGKTSDEDWLDVKTGVDKAINALSEAVDIMTHHISVQPEEQVENDSERMRKEQE